MAFLLLKSGLFNGTENLGKDLRLIQLRSTPGKKEEVRK